jgi:hypothetical protein
LLLAFSFIIQIIHHKHSLFILNRVNDMTDTAEIEDNDVNQAIEESWDEQFEFQKKYRFDNNLTGTAFLRQLKLPVTLLPYLYSKLRQPSQKPSTLGGSLRSAIRNVQTNPPDICETNKPPDLLEEYFITHKPVFKNLGIFAVDIGDEGELEVYAGKDIEDSKVREIFADFEMDGLTELMDHIRVNVFFPAAKFESPVAM